MAKHPPGDGAPKENLASKPSPLPPVTTAPASDSCAPPPDLQKRIEAQDIEIARLTQMLQVLIGNEGQNCREAKILELSKRNRDLNLVLEKERRCSRKWKYQLSLIKEELLRKKQEEEALGSTAEKKAEKESKELQDWKEKYNQTNAKLLEVQAARSILSVEVSKLQHALQREVGEHVSISKVLEDGGDWKGRSQQICLLKDKISELKSKLKKSLADESEHTQCDSIENAQRRDYEQMGMKLMTCREELRNTKQKLDGILARRNVLENEGQGPELYGQKVGGPLSLDLIQRQHRLAASFHDLKRHCYQQELQIQAQAELIDYLRAIASSQHDEEVKQSEGYEMGNYASQASVTNKSIQLSNVDNNKILDQDSDLLGHLQS